MPEAALLAQSRQLIRVETEGWDHAQGTLQLFTRAHERAPWQPTGPAFVAWIGRNGSAWRSDQADPKDAALRGPRKREGDGRSPVGLFALGDLWGYGAVPPPGVTLPYHAIDDRDRCVDDAASADYNQLRRAPPGGGKEPWQSAERLRMVTDHYKLLVPIDYNGLLSQPSASPRPRRGAGSCIFLHIAPPPGTGTAGCTALSEPDLRRVLALLDPSQRPLFLLLPRPARAQARIVWQLPFELFSPPPAPPDPAPRPPR